MGSADTRIGRARRKQGFSLDPSRGRLDHGRMRLAHAPEQITRLRAPTASGPLRVLVSGCLAGLPCGIDGTDYGMGVGVCGVTISSRGRSSHAIRVKTSWSIAIHTGSRTTSTTTAANWARRGWRGLRDRRRAPPQDALAASLPKRAMPLTALRDCCHRQPDVHRSRRISVATPQGRIHSIRQGFDAVVLPRHLPADENSQQGTSREGARLIACRLGARAARAGRIAPRLTPASLTPARGRAGRTARPSSSAISTRTIAWRG